MPPKKGKKMDLNAFLMDETTGGSWADEMDALPTGPSGDPNAGGGLGGSHLSRGMGGDRGGFGGSGMSGGFDSDRPPRAEVPFPTAPPYTAFVGNLSFEVGEADLESFFTGLTTTSIRLVQGHDGKPKGFGYVEFAAADDLTNALAMSGTNMDGRTVRISVAEAPTNREGRADAEVSWTRQGPLAALPGRSGGGGFDRPRTEGFGSQAAGAGGEDVVRDGPIRGGKFVASAPSELRRPGGFGDRSSSGGPPGSGGFGQGGPRDFAPAPVSDVEREGPIRGGRFVASAPAPERPAFGGERRTSGTGPADEEKTWSRQGPLAALPGTQRPGAFGAPRAGSFGDRTPPQNEQPQRQRLQLSARSSANASTEVSPTSSPGPSARPSPFGAAKPVNNAEREREIEEKLAREREAMQTKLAAEKERREASGFGAARKAASPFGDAKPVVAAPLPPATEAPKSPESAAARKEGLSYSSLAAAKSDPAVDEAAQKVAETTL